jgi:hypothetical protein
MRKIKDILRLRQEAGLSYRSISQTLNIGYGTVVDYLERAESTSVNWPLPAELNERELGRLLFPTQPRTGQRRFAEPDFQSVHHELRVKFVTKHLLWQEYRQQHPADGYSYAQFCHRYLKWLGCQQHSMRQIHRAGEKLFVDYCGPTMVVVNADTGEVRSAQIFCGCAWRLQLYLCLRHLESDPGGLVPCKINCDSALAPARSFRKRSGYSGDR